VKRGHLFLKLPRPIPYEEKVMEECHGRSKFSADQFGKMQIHFSADPSLPVKDIQPAYGQDRYSR